MSDGLEGVIVAETAISGIDGEAGRLWIRGWDLPALAAETGFEAVLALLWEGTLPSPAAWDELRAGLGAARVAAFAELPRIGGALETADAMEALRGATAALRGLVDPAAPSAARVQRLALVGALPVFGAAWLRSQAGLPPVAPDAGLVHARDFLRMLDDAEPQPARVRALDRYWVTVAEHGMNASTFAARVVASTQADPVSVITAALGALKGPLHGGAPGPVLDMLDAVRAEGDARGWIQGELAAGRRIMGMGHRVYRVRDPRAAVLEDAVRDLDRAGVRSAYLETAREVERTATRILTERHPDRPIAANVEFATALLLDALQLPRGLFTAVFAMARVAGWIAHADEQRRDGRLLRPRQRYVGARPDASPLLAQPA